MIKRELKRIPNKRKQEKALVTKSFYNFFKKSFRQLEPNKPFKDNWHYREICQILQDETHRLARFEPSTFDVLIFCVPPRTSKSYIVARAWNAWTWGIYPHLRFLSASYAATLAESHAMDTRNLIRSPWYQNLFGDVYRIEGKDGQQRFDNNKGGRRIAAGVDGPVTGEGGDIIFVDDPLKREDANSDAVREKVNKWFGETFFNRVNDEKTGLRVVVMQRLHDNDLVGYLLKKGLQIKLISLPAEKKIKHISPAEWADKYVDGLLFPDKLDRDELDKQLKALGPYGFAGQYNQAPAPEGGGKIKREWFPIIKKNDVPEDLVKYYYTDPSEGKINSDEIASGCWSIYRGRIILWEMMSVVKPFPQFIGYRNKSGDYVPQVYDDFVRRNGETSGTIHFMEAKSLGQGYVDYMNETTPYRTVGDNPGSDSKQSRAFREIPTFWSGRFMLVEGEWNEAFLHQIENFPNGSEDGQVDVAASIVRKSDLDYDEEIKEDENQEGKLQEDTEKSENVEETSYTF